MRRIAFALLLLLSTSSCEHSDQDAAALLDQARALVKVGKTLENKSKTASDQTAALQKYQQAAKQLVEIQQKYSSTLVGQGVADGSVDVGGISASTLLEQTIPNLEGQIAAQKDPIATTELLIGRSNNLQEQASLLVALAQQAQDRTDPNTVQRIRRKALSTTQQLETINSRAQLLSQLANDTAMSGDKSLAREITFLALAAAKQSSLPNRNEFLIDIATTYYLLETDQKALEALQSISAKDARSKAIEIIATRLIENGLPDKAIAATELLFDPVLKTPLLSSLSKKAFAEEKHDIGSRLLDLAIANVDSVPSLDQRVSNSVTICELLSIAQRDKECEEVLNQLASAVSSSPKSQDIKLLTKLANAFGDIQQFTRSLELANRAFDLSKKVLEGPDKDAALSAIAIAFIHAKNSTRAVQVALMVKTPAIRAATLIAIAKTASKIGEKQVATQQLLAARSLSSLVPVVEERSRLLLAIRDILVANNDIPQAKEIALQLKNEDKRWRSYLRTFNAALISSGNSEEALTLARSVDDPYTQAILLSEVAKALAKPESMPQAASVLEEAVQVADQGKDASRNLAMAGLLADTMLQLKWPALADTIVSNHDLSDRAILFARIAKSYAENGQRQEGARVLKNALEAAATLSRAEDKARVTLETIPAFTLLSAAQNPEITQSLQRLLE